MPKKSALLVALVLLSLILSSCAPAATPTSNMSFRQSTGAGAPAAAPAQLPAQKGAADNMAIAQSAPAESGADVTRIVIRNANLSIVVKDPGASMDAIAQMAAAMGGFVVSSKLYKISTQEGVEIPQAEISVRVPVAKLNDALDKIKAQVENKDTDILSEDVSGQDVTKEYTDLQSRLINLQDTETQLQKIMDQATKTEDVLAVYNQLVAIREQIEVLKGQIKYYEESAAMSAVSVTLQSQAAIKPLTIGGWKPVGEARNAVQTLIDTLQFIATALIWLVIYVLPVGLVLVAIGMVLRFIFRKVFKSRKRKEVAPVSQTPPPTPPTQA